MVRDVPDENDKTRPYRKEEQNLAFQLICLFIRNCQLSKAQRLPSMRFVISVSVLVIADVAGVIDHVLSAFFALAFAIFIEAFLVGSLMGLDVV
jgi:hypothetical protein